MGMIKNKAVRLIAVMMAMMFFAVTFLTACSTQHEHTFSTAWQYDDTTHWHVPTCEHSTLKGSIAAHTYSDGECIVCGYKKSSDTGDTVEDGHVHSYAEEWSRNVDYHWHVAVCEHTNMRADYEKHVFSNNRCVYCGMTDPVYTGDLPDMYTLTYQAGEHGSGKTPEVKEYAEGQRFTLQPASTFTAEEGWKFAGWSDGYRIHGAGVLFTMPAHAVVLTATWEEVKINVDPDPIPETYSVTYKAGSHGSGDEPAEQSYKEGADFYLRAATTFTAETGWQFVGWSDGTNTYGASIVYTMPARDVIFTAVWEQIPAPDPDTDPDPEPEPEPDAGPVGPNQDVPGDNWDNKTPSIDDVETGQGGGVYTNHGQKVISDDGWVFTEVRDEAFQVIGYAVSMGTYAGEEIIIPSQYNKLPVVEIFDFAFENSHITKVTIPASVRQISYAAFRYCDSLSEIVIPDTVLWMQDWAFAYCSGLTKVTLSAEIKYIPAAAFFQCTNLSTLTFTNQSASSGDIRLSDNVRSIGHDAFNKCTSLKIFCPGSSLKVFGDNTFLNCSLTRLDISDLGEWSKIEFTASSNPMYHAGFKANGYKPIAIYSNGQAVKELTITGVERIGSFSFYGVDIETLKIGDGVRVLGIGAFRESSVKSLEIADSVTTLESSSSSYGVFARCLSLESVKLGKGITKLSAGTFQTCSSLKTIDLTHVEIVGTSTFSYCTSLETVSFGGGNSQLTSIGYDAFGYCTALTSIALPDSLKIIDVWAFRNCVGLNSITIPDSVTEIGYNALYNTGYYNNISNWTGGALYAGRHLIEVNTAGAEFTVKENTVGICDYAFMSCTDMTKIYIPVSLKRVGTDAFSGCVNLKEVEYGGNALDWIKITFANALSSPMYYAETLTFKTQFSGELVIPEGVSAIPAGTFKGNTGITKVTIPSTVTDIGDEAFMDCINLMEIVFSGDDKITSIGKDAFKDTGYFKNSGNWEHGVLILNRHHILATNETFNVSTYVIDDDIRTISAGAFASRQITDLTIGANVRYIGANAFYTNSLVSVTFANTSGSWYAKNLAGAMRVVTVNDNLAGNAQLFKNYPGEWRKI